MFNILKKLKKFAKDSVVEEDMEKLSEEAKKRIKVSVSRKDIENLINPSDGEYNTDIKEISIERM